MVGLFLKQADKFILQNNFDEADALVAKALAEDPSSMYARAYKERIDTLRREYLAKKKDDDLQAQFSKEQAATTDTREAPLPQTPADPAATERFRARLYELWRDGVLTQEERSELDGEQRRLKVSPDQRHSLEQEVKLKCYLDAVRVAIRDGTISPVKSHALEDLRKKFSVSADEHLAIEGRILWELQHKLHHAAILLIDDESDFLTVISQGLLDAGYEVLTASSPEEALETLKASTPDIILCDIKFDNSPLDGFALYKRVRSKREFAMVPFLFVTGVDDDWVYRQGLELGVDDYIMKPFTMSTLTAAVEGKLQRYEELRRALQ